MIDMIKNWFVAAVPNPTDDNISVQLGCHFEEVSEMMTAVGLKMTAEMMSTLGDSFKTKEYPLDISKIDRKELLDALCDQIVTAVGVAHMLGMDIERGLEEVNRSNWSKFVDGKPVFADSGKIKKSENYVAPDLTGMYE